MSRYEFGRTVIDYEVIGDGIPILFLHGWGVDRRIMSGAFEPLFSSGEVSGFRRIYIDLPGMGKSSAGDVSSADDILNVLYGFVREVIGSSFILAGESFGGYLARGFLCRYPQLLRGILLLCPLMIPGFRQGHAVPLRVIERDDEFLKTLTKQEYDSFTFMNVILTREVWERYKRDVLPALEEADSRFLNEVLDGSFSFDPDASERECTLPCLVITGRQDTEVGYTDQLSLLERFVNATYCVVSAAGHNLQLEQPEMFGALVKQWLCGSEFQ